MALVEDGALETPVALVPGYAGELGLVAVSMFGATRFEVFG